MCFSASASFISSTLLVSSGIYCISKVIQSHHYFYFPIASIPLLFGIQQAWEGMLWLSFNENSPQGMKIYAFGFLFFSHFLWLFWMTIAALMVETRKRFKYILTGLGILGFLYGVFLYLPLFFRPHWLSVNVLNGSIRYQIRVISTNIIHPYIGIFLYIVVSLTGLFLSNNKWLNYLGLMLVAAFIFTEFFFDYAFISVWCFFAAIISLYLISLFYSEKFMPKTILK